MKKLLIIVLFSSSIVSYGQTAAITKYYDELNHDTIENSGVNRLRSDKGDSLDFIFEHSGVKKQIDFTMYYLAGHPVCFTRGNRIIFSYENGKSDTLVTSFK